MITPSPGTCCWSISKSVQRCSTNISHSSKLSLSSNRSMRSRAVNLPLACWASIRCCPPPRRARSRLASSSARISCMIFSFKFCHPERSRGISSWLPGSVHSLRKAFYSVQPPCSADRFLCHPEHLLCHPERAQRTEGSPCKLATQVDEILRLRSG